MRKSVQRRQTERLRQERRQQRAVLWLLPIAVASVLGVMLLWQNAKMKSYIAENNAAVDSSQAEFERLMPILIQRRIDIEIAENKTVRDLIYKHTAAGYMTPPSLSTDKCNYLESHNDPSMPDVLVNKHHCLDPLGYVPKLTAVYGATLHTAAVEPYKKMIDASKLAGHDISSSSSYRSYADQAYTYQYWESYSGHAEADMYSAYPGYSEHQTGFAVDLQTPGCVLECFGDSAAYDWIIENAHKYGFIERYPDGLQDITGYNYEPWHWRFVGVETATEYMRSGAKTLEEFWGIR